MRMNFAGRAVVLLASALVGAGCSSSGQMESGGTAVQSIRGMQKELTEAKGTVNQSLAAIDQLNSSTDVSKAYKNYASAVEDVEDAGSDAKKRWNDMRTRGREYVTEWEKEADDMQSKEVRSGLTQRRAAVKENYNALTDEARKAREAYDPFLKDLQEIRKALSIDMTRSQVQALQPAFASARAHGQALTAQLDALNGRLGQVATGMAPSGK